MEKYFVYTVNESQEINRVFVDSDIVRHLLESNKNLKIIRSVTNQIAVLGQGEVLWREVKDAPAIELK